MAPPKQNTKRKPSKDSKRPEKRTPSAAPRRKAQADSTNNNDQDPNQIDVSGTIPITLQQLLLNVFKSALLPNETGSQDSEPNSEGSELDTKTLIQTIKSHLYNRDFDSAFADAHESLLRAYALRWSAARALGYAGLFKALLKALVDEAGRDASAPTHVVCIGGGAGAEIVAFAAAWRDLIDEGVISRTEVKEGLSDALRAVSLDDKHDDRGGGKEKVVEEEEEQDARQKESFSASSSSASLSITAVDIADWTAVVKRLSSTIQSTEVPGSRSHSAPLLPSTGSQNADADAAPKRSFNVDFKRLDVLSLTDQDLNSLFRSTKYPSTHSQPQASLVSLMFTLNELFSTSMAKATSFLLRTTDALSRGTFLLVVDSPGSYSTLKLKKESGTTQERQYPMKFLLDHALLSVAKGKWEKIYEQDSRWWRRDAARLVYDVGEGAGLEDMRFQIHVYRRV
ncbi:25S rRNA (uracil2843-N3)-methyltransferase [Aspergillus undulatus]|uniref:25S rRNA (uracil2843-N3)-methyltransferase n=1 Tax=Aspergillus undulatus TaxID=1810928 RepID=UPI003CCCC15E